MPTPLNEILENLGPLTKLAGTWEGDKGDDTAPSNDRGTEKNLFRERIAFEPFGPVDNHEQKLWGLRFTKVAWRLGEDDAFHEASGYWLWDPKAQQALCTFIVPRGVTVLAGATVDADATKFQLDAKCGSETYGICSNLFLDREFKTVAYSVKIDLSVPDTLYYEELTELQMKGRPNLFQHLDKNVLKLVSRPT